MAKKKAFTVNHNLRIITVIKLATKNDNNGNPRRVWVLLNSTPSEIAPTTLSGNVITAIDEGYSGNAEVKKFIATTIEPWHEVLVVWGPTFNTTPAEYRATLKQHSKLKSAATPLAVQMQEKGI